MEPFKTILSDRFFFYIYYNNLGSIDYTISISADIYTKHAQCGVR